MSEEKKPFCDANGDELGRTIVPARIEATLDVPIFLGDAPQAGHWLRILQGTITHHNGAPVLGPTFKPDTALDGEWRILAVDILTDCLRLTLRKPPPTP